MLINFFTDPIGLEAQRIESDKIIDEKIARNAERDEYLENIMRNKIYAKRLSHLIHAEHHKTTAPVITENGMIVGFSDV